MDPNGAGCLTSWAGLPRSRGDGPAGRHSIPPPVTAPPLARGWTPQATALEEVSGGSGGSLKNWLPRSRGDGPVACGWPRAVAGDGHSTRVGPASAPPLARGWTRVLAGVDLAAGGSPARAGMDPMALPYCSHCSGLPRSRGDFCACSAPALAAAAASRASQKRASRSSKPSGSRAIAIKSRARVHRRRRAAARRSSPSIEFLYLR